MKVEQAKQEIKNRIEISREQSKYKNGGQSCGVEQLGTILKSDELQIEIKVNYFRSNYRNKEYGLMLFDLIIDDLIK